MTLVIIDFNRTLYDPDTNDLMRGATELLQELKQRGAKVVLVSRLEGNRMDVLEHFGIAEYFDDVVFVGGDKTGELFAEIIARHGATSEESFVIGDHPYQEIRAGNEAGAYTIYFKQGAFSSLDPETEHDVADVTIGNLLDALRIIV